MTGNLRKELAPKLQGRYATLRPLTRGDYGFVLEVAVSRRNSLRWTEDGDKVAVSRIWFEALAQFLVVGSDDTPAGLARLIAPDWRTRTATAEFALAERARGAGWPIEGARLLVDYAFAVFDLRKLYVRAPRYVLDDLGPHRVLRPEGILREHEFHDGEPTDIHILAIHKEDWTAFGARSRPKTSSPLSLNDFLSILTPICGKAVGELCPETPLAACTLDSLTRYELMVTVDALSGARNDFVTVAPDWSTVGDAFASYCADWAAASNESLVPIADPE